MELDEKQRLAKYIPTFVLLLRALFNIFNSSERYYSQILQFSALFFHASENSIITVLFEENEHMLIAFSVKYNVSAL